MSEIRLRNALLTSIKRTWWLIAVLLILMSGFRLLFTVQFAHPEIWSEFLSSLPMAFAFGAVHDLRILLIFALPPTFSLLWMRDRTLDRWKSWLHRTSIYWFLGISIIVIVLASEQIYYSYFSTRFSILAFGAIEDDVPAVLASAWQTYPLLLYVSVGLVLEYFVLRIIRRAFHFISFLHAAKAPQAHEVDRALNLHLVTHTGLTVLLCLLPLTPIFVSLDNQYSQTAFVRIIPENGVEKLAETMWTRFSEEQLSTATQFGFGEDPQAAIDAFSDHLSVTDQGPLLQRLPLQAMEPTPIVDSPPHVILVVMESFATHLLQYQSPEFDLLGPALTYFEEGVLYERFLPCDNISVGTILGITLNLPYRPNTKHLSQTEQKSRSYPSSMAKLFRERGYDTAFYYGGPSDWRELDQFLPKQGFEEMMGMQDLIEHYQLDLEKDGGPWGVWDEYLFRAVTERLKGADKPVFMVVFTTTNHSPHRVPADWRAKELLPPARLLERTGPLNEIQSAQVETFRYAAYQLGIWLDGLKEKDLMQQTIVGVTGDHTAGMGIPFSHQELLLQRAVPFLLLMPENIAEQFEADPLTPGSHKDLAPTLFHAAGLGPYGYRGLGTSLLAPKARHLGFNSSGLVLTPQGAVRIHQDGYDSLRWRGDSLQLESSKSNPEDESALKTYQAALSLTDWLIYEEPPTLEERNN